MSKSYTSEEVLDFAFGVLPTIEDRKIMTQSICSMSEVATDSSGYSPLALAVLRKMDMDLIRLLLASGANPDQETDAGDTAMFLAIEEDLEYMVMELAWHASPDYVSSKGDSTLSVAKWFENDRIISRLESMGFKESGAPTSYERYSDLLC